MKTETVGILYALTIRANYPEDGEITYYYIGTPDSLGIMSDDYGCLTDFSKDMLRAKLLLIDGVDLEFPVNKMVSYTVVDCFDYHDCPVCCPNGSYDYTFDAAEGVVKYD